MQPGNREGLAAIPTDSSHSLDSSDLLRGRLGALSNVVETDDLAIGNIIGSNIFNSLAVVGLAGVIQPMAIPLEIINRDWPLMAILTASLFVFGYVRKGTHGRISRMGGLGLVAVYAGYTVYLINVVLSA
jgi:Ca2+/Na+ antiporter